MFLSFAFAPLPTFPNKTQDVRFQKKSKGEEIEESITYPLQGQKLESPSPRNQTLMRPQSSPRHSRAARRLENGERCSSFGKLLGYFL